MIGAEFRRIRDAGRAPGGHVIDDNLAFACDQEVAAIMATFRFEDGSKAVFLMTRDEASALSIGLAEVLCDG